MSIHRARLFYRDIGQGHPTVVLHGGPDFDHNYLLPEMDRLANSLRLIYYDQRGRGRSAEGVEPGLSKRDFRVEAEYYRIHFRVALPRPELVEQVVGRLRTHFDEKSVLTARAIENRLYEETRFRDDYDLLSPLGRTPSPHVGDSWRSRLRSGRDSRTHRRGDT